MFSRNMLPTLGVMWHQFTTFREAQKFARWAERETANDEYPCETEINRMDDLEVPVWEVKVKNW